MWKDTLIFTFQGSQQSYIFQIITLTDKAIVGCSVQKPVCDEDHQNKETI